MFTKIKISSLCVSVSNDVDTLLIVEVEKLYLCKQRWCKELEEEIHKISFPTDRHEKLNVQETWSGTNCEQT